MKSPQELAARLARQWQRADWRERQLLDGLATWPLTLHIGQPSARCFRDDGASVQAHLQQWRAVDERAPGQVVWHERQYRDGASPARLLALWCHAPADEVIRACAIATQLEPGCAQGKPLRALQLCGSDSKFFERHEGLLTALADARFDGEVSRQGLTAFLGADPEGEHWLLVVPLADGLLPFSRLRLAADDLQNHALPGTHVLLVENERCLHQLPRGLPGTVAILGAGRNLGWLAAPWLRQRQVAYWGDLDTWGLNMLAVARGHVPGLTALLMDGQTFDSHAGMAVREPVPADLALLAGYPDLLALAQMLGQREKGRIEQEFLPASVVGEAVARWHAGVCKP